MDQNFVEAFKALVKSIKADFSVQQEETPGKKLKNALKQAQKGEVESFENFEDFKRAMLGEMQN